MVGNGNVFVYGGWDGNQMLNDLHVLHTDLVSAPQPILTWSKPITSGPVPGPRAGHTSSAVGNRLFVFGGGNGIRYLNDLHLLDAETMTWSQAYVAGTSPAARSRHTATLVGTKLVVIGGGDDSRVYNDVYVLDTVTMSWTRPITKGPNPTGRWGHTATLIGTDQLLIFGGHDGTRMLNDVHILDTESMAWQQISPHGQIPCPRAGHTATSVTGKLLVFGGGDGSRILNDLYVFDPATLTFTRPTLQHPAHTPAGRCAHTATPLDDSTLLVFGGGDGGRRFKDLYLLDAEQVIKPPKEKTKAKSPARRGSGGHADDKRKNDITVWLSGLGLRKYVDKFVHEEIDVDTLPYLTEEHLEKLGVSTIGARLKILAAVDQLRDEQAGRALAGPNRKPSDTLRRSTDLVGEMKQSLDLLLVATSALAQALATLSYPDKEEASGGECDDETETESDFDNSFTPSPVASPRDKVSSTASIAAALSSSAAAGGGGGLIPTPPPPPPPHFYASTTDHINALNSFFRNPGSCRGNTNTNLSCGSASTQIIPGVHLHLPNNAPGGGGGGKRTNNSGGGGGGGAASTKANLRHSQGKLPQHTAKPPAGGGDRAQGGGVAGNGNGGGGDAERNATKAPS